MIVPAQRLLLVAALIVVPCAAAAGLFPNLALIVAVVLLTLTCAVVTDAVLGLSAKTACAAETPSQLRLVRGSPGSLPVILRNDNFVTVRIGIVSPPSVQSAWERSCCSYPRITVPESNGRALAWPAATISSTPLPETPSPLGLWHVWLLPQNCRLRVYPDLRDETLALLPSRQRWPPRPSPGRQRP
jgi:hypothetical protein